MKLRKKMKKQNGFTLIEMLIVVAIIAILVAVSIPVVNTALERTKRATDAANERAAKAEMMVRYLSGDTTEAIMTETDYFYDAENGSIGVSEPTKGYGKCNSHKGGYIKLKISEKGEVTVTWAGVTEGAPHGSNVDTDPTS